MTPKTEAELADTIRCAAGKGTKLRIQGGGTRAGLGRAVTADSKLDVSGISGIELYEAGALTLVAKAGTPVSEIEAALDKEGQQLPFEPMDHRGIFGSNGTPTIGGVVAGNISGPRRIQAGACRDSLIGVRFVDGTGEVLKNGGRVMKNVTGYDLVKLMAGSMGSLGVLTEVAFKVLPKPEVTGTLVLEGLDDARAIEALSAALTSPFDVSGAAHVSSETAAQTLIRVEGFKDSVAYRTERLADLLSEYGAAKIETGAKKSKALWASLRDLGGFTDRDASMWRLSVKPTDGPDVVAALRAQSADIQVQYDWGGGLIWVAGPEALDPSAALNGKGGFAQPVRGAGADGNKKPDAIARIEAGLRTKFDPAGILNPGIMGS